MARLWRNTEGTREGKYLVKRRDGTVPDWPSFVIGARDPNAPATLLKYAEEAKKNGFDPEYVADIIKLAAEFDEYREEHGEGDPDACRHRTDDPETIAEMTKGKGS